jgi:hypothetical protein
VGCIGGVGVFLIITGLNVSTRLQDDEISLSLNTLLFFIRGHNLALWAPAFALAGLLRVITLRWHHQLILPTCAPPFPSLTLGEGLSISFSQRFLDYTDSVLFRCFRCRVRVGLTQKRRMVIRGCEARGQVVSILYLFRYAISRSGDFFP